MGALILEDFILKKWSNITPSMQVTISKLLGMLNFKTVCLIFHNQMLIDRFEVLIPRNPYNLTSARERMRV